MRFSLLAMATLLSSGANVAAQETVTYTYDAFGRLAATSASGGTNNGMTSSYSYDVANNRTSVTVSTSSTPTSGCFFAIEDASGNDEFTIYVAVRRTGTCASNVQVAYTTDYFLAPSGTVTFTPQDTLKLITIPPNCCATGTITYYNVQISIASGAATISDANAVVEVYGNG